MAVVPRFQNPWALTSALDSAGTTTCPSCRTNLAAPLTVRLVLARHDDAAKEWGDLGAQALVTSAITY